MNFLKRATLLTLALLMALGLTACDSLGIGKPDMPMEITIDGHTIALGQTSVNDLADWGWTVKFSGTQNEIKSDAKYVACYFTVRKSEKGSGDQFSVSVWVPFQKNKTDSTHVDFSEEEKMAKEGGVVCRVDVRKDAAENFTVVYNGKDYQDLTWNDVKEMGATETQGSNEYSPAYKLEVAQGSLNFKKGYTGEDEPGEFGLSMNVGAFSKLQK